MIIGLRVSFLSLPDIAFAHFYYENGSFYCRFNVSTKLIFEIHHTNFFSVFIKIDLSAEFKNQRSPFDNSNHDF